MKQFAELLEELNACSEAIEWAGEKNIEEIVSTCHRGDWLLWLAKKVNVDLRALTLAKARCAKTVIHLMKDERSVNAVNVAEKFGLGDATREELKSAAHDAYDAYDDAAAAYAAYDDAAAAYAAYDTAYAAASAAYAAASAASAAYAAASAASAAASAADAASAAASADAKNKNQTADICREILGSLIIDRVNELLK